MRHMTNPDAAEDKALAAANKIATQVGSLWMSAHMQGIRDGMEIAAQMVDGSLSTSPDIRPIADAIAQAIRLAALHFDGPSEVSGE